ncbi:MAG: response regulator transcription factor [Proteobacteria bacterium]|nr:response regulator transcription factor [Pseudomonadota bacterium]
MHFLCLIIEPVAEAARRLQRELPTYGFRPYAVDSCPAAMALLRQWRFDAVLLDADSVGDHATTALHKVRRHVRAPVAVLTHARDEATQIGWLEAGASDVVALPVSSKLLAAKLRRLIEAGVEPDDDPAELTVGPLTMDARRHTASVDGKPLVLTAHQFELLYVLATRLGQFVHREAIARALRSPCAESGRSADVHVYRIRKKLRAMGVGHLHLDTVHGRGYCLSIDVPASAIDADEEDDDPLDPYARGGTLQPVA